LEEETAATDNGVDADEGHEDANEWYAGGFHAEQFKTFAQIAERDKACQQDGQWHGFGDKRQAAVPKEFPQEVDGQTFADEIVHPHPQELHDKDEEANEERACKKKQELLDDVYVERLENLHSFLCL
jgi:hypothetical protein